MGAAVLLLAFAFPPFTVLLPHGTGLVLGCTADGGQRPPLQNKPRFGARRGLGRNLYGHAMACPYARSSYAAGLATPVGAQGLAPLLTTADSVLEDMSRITGLPIKASLKKQIVSRAEIRKYLRENIHEEYTAHELRVQEAVLKAFGLVSRDFDLENFLITFYTEQAAGFYDPRRKTMFMADWLSEDMQKLVLAHELTHALQDQSFDLQKFLRGARDDDDATNARQAVVEGYATAAMMQHLIEPVELATLPSLEPLMDQVVRLQMQEFPAFSRAPFFFRFQALFPYSEGMGFIQRGLALGGWKKLNQLFSRPPTATKEIFEPQVYFGARALPKISLPHPASLTSLPTLKLLDENVMGAMGYYSLVGQLISESEAKSVSAAWLADRYILYEHPTTHSYILVARTRWSSPEAALAFFRDCHAIVAKKYPELVPDKRSATDLFVGSAANSHIILLLKGDECLWAEGVPAAQTEAMLSYIQSLGR